MQINNIGKIHSIIRSNCSINFNKTSVYIQLTNIYIFINVQIEILIG